MLERFEQALSLEKWPQKAAHPPSLERGCPHKLVNGKPRTQAQTGIFIRQMNEALALFELHQADKCQIASFYRSELIPNVSRSFSRNCLAQLDESHLPATLFDPDRFHEDQGVTYRLSSPVQFGIESVAHIFKDISDCFPQHVNEEEARAMVIATNKLINTIMKLTEEASEQVETVLNLRSRKRLIPSPYQLTDSGIDVRPEIADRLSTCLDYEDPSIFGKSFCPAYYSDFVARYVKMLARLSVELSVRTSKPE